MLSIKWTTVRGYRKHILNLWLNKYTFWVSQEKLVDEANIIHKNSCMTESEIEELERNLAENDTCKEKDRSADDAGKNLGEKLWDILTVLESDQVICNLEEEEVAITEEIAEVLERRQKNKLPVLRDVPKKKLFEETAKVDKVLYKIKTHSITKANKLFYAGAIVNTDRQQRERQQREKNQ